MARIENVDAVIKVMKDRAAERKDAPTVMVGYTQAYAVYVHENLEAYHPVGQAKFLSEPLHRLKDTLARMIRQDLQRGMDLGDAMLRAGLLLQRESQMVCPVDSGALRASAFTILDEGSG